ncbi:expressed unknown protein [Seminavis robusta]|uniref:Uncharacterized protein n=1 Tax=Seminavis robusta TaxID=568900 RepID=A0A9N8HV98_9STRA|nr:expressed unknown protein [Seminavis robusta]|eukprot:Sro1952_g307460.1 n/a (263) ;mRNA; r:9929-10952
MIRHTAALLPRRTLAKALTARAFVTKSPGPDPLEVLRKECVNRRLCTVEGYRAPGVHWVFSVAMTPRDSDAAPNLRTIGIQRVSPAGIDFVMKKGCKTATAIAEEHPLAILYSQGKYAPGQSAEQWRGEGVCKSLPLQELLDVLPHYTLTGMLVSKRIEKEALEADDDSRGDVSVDRLALMNRSHVTELTQKTRLELENNEVSEEELEKSIQAFRFLPDRLERMHGGPDSILWERWEWLRSASAAESEGAIPWNDPMHLLPH